MKTIKCIVGIGCIWIAMKWYAQPVQTTNDLQDAIHVHVPMDVVKKKDELILGNSSFVKTVDERMCSRIEGIEVHNGPMLLLILTSLLPNATDFSCAFVGVAFRVNKDNLIVESIYVRPADIDDVDQIRRKPAIRYFSLPDYKFDRLKKARHLSMYRMQLEH